MLIPFVVGFFVGGFVGVGCMALMAASAYDKGREDERRIYGRKSNQTKGSSNGESGR